MIKIQYDVYGEIGIPDATSKAKYRVFRYQTKKHGRLLLKLDGVCAQGYISTGRCHSTTSSETDNSRDSKVQVVDVSPDGYVKNWRHFYSGLKSRYKSIHDAVMPSKHSPRPSVIYPSTDSCSKSEYKTIDEALNSSKQYYSLHNMDDNISKCFTDSLSMQFKDEKYRSIHDAVDPDTSCSVKPTLSRSKTACSHKTNPGSRSHTVTGLGTCMSHTKEHNNLDGNTRYMYQSIHEATGCIDIQTVHTKCETFRHITKPGSVIWPLKNVNKCIYKSIHEATRQCSDISKHEHQTENSKYQTIQQAVGVY